MGWSRLKQEDQLFKAGITSRNKSVNQIRTHPDPIELLGRMADNLTS